MVLLFNLSGGNRKRARSLLYPGRTQTGTPGLFGQGEIKLDIVDYSAIIIVVGSLP